jgi:hypothetical protein
MAHLTLGVKANVQLKSSIPIDAKVEISPKDFTLGVKAKIEKNFSICCPKLLINAELYGLCIGPKADQKTKDTIMEFGKPICNPLAQCSKYLVIA